MSVGTAALPPQSPPAGRFARDGTVQFWWKVGFEDRFQHQHCCSCQPDPARSGCPAPCVPVGLRYENSSDGAIADHAMGFPVLHALSLCTCRRHYPGAASESIASLISSRRIVFPIGLWVDLRIVLFEDYSAFTRVAACTLSFSPISMPITAIAELSS